MQEVTMPLEKIDSPFARRGQSEAEKRTTTATIDTALEEGDLRA